MPQSESLVSKLREDAHLECPSKPDNPAESVVDVDVERNKVEQVYPNVPLTTALGNCIYYFSLYLLIKYYGVVYVSHLQLQRIQRLEQYSRGRFGG